MKPVHRCIERPGSITICRPTWLRRLAQRSMWCMALSFNAAVPVTPTSNRLMTGQEQTSDHHGTGETLAGDFMVYAQAAIGHTWQVRNVLTHWRQAIVGHQP